MYRQAIAEIFNQLNRSIFFLILIIAINFIDSFFTSALIKLILMFGNLLILYVYCLGFTNKIPVTRLQDWLNAFKLINQKIIYNLIILLALLSAILFIINTPLSIISYIYGLHGKDIIMSDQIIGSMIFLTISIIIGIITQYFIIVGLAYMIYYGYDTSKSLISAIKLMPKVPSVLLLLLLINILDIWFGTPLKNVKTKSIYNIYFAPLIIPFIIIVLFIYFRSGESTSVVET